MGVLDWLKNGEPQKPKPVPKSEPAERSRSRRDPYPLLASDEPPAFEIVNPNGKSKVFLTCDHGGHAIPRALKNLGLPAAMIEDHWGWDPGAATLARRLSAELDATLVLSTYSRLVIDCNRPLGSSSSIVTRCGNVRVGPNEGMDEDSARVRAEACFWPYHRAITRILDDRLAARRPTVLLSIHSFTPELQGKKRPWEIGYLYGRDSSFASALIDWTRQERPDLKVGDNEPYKVTDSGDYTIPVHGEARGLHAALVELRNNEIRDDTGLTFWSALLAAAFRAVEPKLKFMTGQMAR